MQVCLVQILAENEETRQALLLCLCILAFEQLEKMDGVLVAPGFGERGMEGKITAIQIARTGKIPFFGICLGMQMAIVEFARNVVGIAGANSGESRAYHPEYVIDLMPEQE